MARAKHRSSTRDGSKFVALPNVVLDCPAYRRLSFSARALLVDIARQFTGSNNGRLVLCEKAMKARGWASSTTIQRAAKELLVAGFICKTRQGYRPNTASWYALTWQALHWSKEMDISAAAFQRGAYLKNSDPQKMGYEAPV